MGYNVTDLAHGADEDGNGGIPCRGRGEVCYRGPNIFRGYFRNPEKTAEAVDEDGWLHSGDIGVWTENGALKIVDRKKNIFKLSQGEYVAAEKIENVYLKSSFVAQIFVYGNSLQAILVAIVVPDADHAKVWAAENGKENDDLENLIADAEFTEAVQGDMTRIGKDQKLRGFENARKLFFTAEPFSDANGLLTPTFKLKRNAAQAKYQAQIDEMYADQLIAGQAGLKQGEEAKRE
jgi:long-chain acyl-CoA synthetase